MKERSQNYLEIKYEDMCLKLDATVNKISKFLEMDYNKNALETIRSSIKPSLIKYKDFSEKELQEIIKEVKINMEKLGYGMEE